MPVFHEYGRVFSFLKNSRWWPASQPEPSLCQMWGRGSSPPDPFMRITGGDLHARSAEDGAMSNNTAKKTGIYRNVGRAGTLILFAGCFFPILVDGRVSAAQIFFDGLVQVGRGASMEKGLEVLMAFMLLLMATRGITNAIVGKVEDMRGLAIQVWVVLVASYAYQFGTVFPIHPFADWGWSVLFLGATLLSVGSFWSHLEMEEPEKPLRNDSAYRGVSHGVRRVK